MVNMCFISSRCCGPKW